MKRTSDVFVFATYAPKKKKNQSKSAMFTLGDGRDSGSLLQGALSMRFRDKAETLLTYHLQRAWVTSRPSTIREQFLTKSENITTQRDPGVHYHHL